MLVVAGRCGLWFLMRAEVFCQARRRSQPNYRLFLFDASDRNEIEFKGAGSAMRFAENIFGHRFVTTLAMVLPAALSADVAAAGTGAPVPWQMGFQEAATPFMEKVVSFDNLLLYIITAITVFVLVLLLYCMFRFNSKANPVPSKTTHNTLIEVLWTVLPILVLLVIAIPSFRLLYFDRTFPEIDMTIKATGNQWNWSYAYPDHGPIEFDSLMLQDDERKEGQPRLLSVDNQVVVPVNKNIRVIVTASDVIHNWAVPAFGIKIDAVPGRLNEIWFRATETGIYYGQCSELCGKDHAFMPIAVRVVSDAEFAEWVVMAKEKFAAAPSGTKVARLVSDAGQQR